MGKNIKCRVETVQEEGLENKYFPQYKGWFGWRNFPDDKGEYIHFPTQKKALSFNDKKGRAVYKK